MTKQKEVVRDYKVSDATLKQAGDDLVGSARRDITEMSTRGVTTPDLDAMEAELNAFADIPTDEELDADISIATEVKNEARNTVDTFISTIRTMAENKWGLKSAKYRKYSFGQVSQLSDEKLYRLAKRVHRVGTQQLTDLNTEGLTQTNLDDFLLAIAAFDVAIDNKGDAEKDRDNATEDRILAGNEVFKKMKRISRIGKDIWYETSEAKYNDYVMAHIFGTGENEWTPITVPQGTTVVAGEAPEDDSAFEVQYVSGTAAITACTGANDATPCGAGYVFNPDDTFSGDFGDLNISGGAFVKLTNPGPGDVVIRFRPLN